MFLIVEGFGVTYDVKNKCERLAFTYCFNVISTDFDYKSKEACVSKALDEAKQSLKSIKPSWIDEIRIIMDPLDPNEELIQIHHKHLSCKYYTCYISEENCERY